LANEHVPSYQCPAQFPYLLDTNYAPAGTTLILGVEIRQAQPWPIGVSISRATAVKESTRPPGWAGPLFGGGISGEGIGSSATNWTFGTATYQVVLHCTNDPEQGYRVDSRGSIIW
jgi:hypothetical protein